MRTSGDFVLPAAVLVVLATVALDQLEAAREPGGSQMLSAQAKRSDVHPLAAATNPDQSPSNLRRKSVQVGQYLLTEFFDDRLSPDCLCRFELSRHGHTEYHCDFHSTGNYLAEFGFVDPDLLVNSDDFPVNQDSREDGAPIVARDVNGDGVPVLIVNGDTGGNAVGSEQTIIVRLGQNGPQQIYFGDPLTVKRLRNGKYKITCCALYGGGSTVEAVYVNVPLVWNGRSYAALAKQMRRPKPSAKQLQTIADRLCSAVQPPSSPRFTSNVMAEIVSLIFSGNAQAAHTLMAMVFQRSDKIAVDEVSGFSSGEVFSQRGLWKAIIKNVKENDFVNGRTDSKPSINYLPIVKRLNPGLFA
jgi:hypothetical protein